MSLKANALAVLERNRQRNYCATGIEKAPQLSSSKTGLELRGVAQAGIACIRDACQGLTITPEQFLALTTEEDRGLIRSGKFSPECLRTYAVSFDEGIRSRRIVFHPTTGALLNHN